MGPADVAAAAAAADAAPALAFVAALPLRGARRGVPPSPDVGVVRGRGDGDGAWADADRALRKGDESAVVARGDGSLFRRGTGSFDRGGDPTLARPRGVTGVGCSVGSGAGSTAIRGCANNANRGDGPCGCGRPDFDDRRAS